MLAHKSQSLKLKDDYVEMRRASTGSVVYPPAVGEEIDHNVIIMIREECFPVRE